MGFQTFSLPITLTLFNDDHPLVVALTSHGQPPKLGCWVLGAGSGAALPWHPGPIPQHLVHSPASASSGAAAPTGRGAACRIIGAFTYRRTASAAPWMFNWSNRNPNRASRSAEMAERTSAGMCHMSFLNGPIAFLRLL